MVRVIAVTTRALKMRTKILAIVTAVVFTLLLFSPLPAQTPTKRLILKDGSYQTATKIEVKGDRVRYYSAERYSWEEIPKALVDWDATNKYEAERAAGKAAGDAAARAEQEAEKKAEEARSPTIVPGLKLPDSGGIFVLDTYQQQPQLVELVQNNGEINKHMGRNIMRAVINPLPSGPKQTVELKGLHARIQAHTSKPDIYVNVNYADDKNDDSGDSSDSSSGNAQTNSQQTSNGKGGVASKNAATKPTEPAVDVNDRFKIVRVETKPKEQVRVVSNLKIGLTGHIKEQQTAIPTTSRSISSQWVKLTPTVPLEPGEYAVVEMLSPKQMNLFVWDFGVNPNAPQNPSVWKPAPTKQVQTGTEESPVLGKRPRFDFQPSAANPRLRVGSDRGEGRGPVYSPDPEYTEAARQAGIQGTVVLRTLIDTEGRPQEIKVMKSLEPGLDEQAIKAVRQWRFPPAMKDGNPVAVPITLEVNFHLYQQPGSAPGEKKQP
jgi:TonB family protein